MQIKEVLDLATHRRDVVVWKRKVSNLVSKHPKLCLLLRLVLEALDVFASEAELELWFLTLPGNYT